MARHPRAPMLEPQVEGFLRRTRCAGGRWAKMGHNAIDRTMGRLGALKRWMYRSGHPNRTAAFLNRIQAMAASRGLPPSAWSRWRSQAGGRAGYRRFRSSWLTSRASATSCRCWGGRRTGSGTPALQADGFGCDTETLRTCSSTRSRPRLAPRSSGATFRSHREPALTSPWTGELPCRSSNESRRSTPYSGFAPSLRAPETVVAHAGAQEPGSTPSP